MRTTLVTGAAGGSVNDFGAVTNLEGLRPLLAKGDSPRAVAESSTTIISAATSEELYDLCRCGEWPAPRTWVGS